MMSKRQAAGIKGVVYNITVSYAQQGLKMVNIVLTGCIC